MTKRSYWGLVMIAVAALSPSLIVADAPLRPESMPWNLDELNRAPDFEWATGGLVRRLFFEGEPYQGKPTRVFAYYTTPGRLADDYSLDKNLPAVVLVHGGMGTAFPQWAKLWAERGYAAITMDLSGRGPNRQPMSDGGPDQADQVKFHTMDQPIKDQWTYHSVANVIRAHSLIRTFSEVDPERTATIGISWGGYLTCIVAGLDHRFKAVASVYGCGFIHKNSAWLDDFEKMSDAHRQKWVQLWEPSQYIGAATMPMLFVSGGTDRFYPPDSLARTIDLVSSPVNMHYVPHFPHGHFFDKPKALEVFVNHHLKGGVTLPKVLPPKVGNGQITAVVEGSTGLIDAALHYTTDDLRGDATTRRWISRKATLTGNTIRAAQPPTDTQCWFLTVTDECEVTISSRLMLQEE